MASERLVAYEELADRVVRIEYRQLERHLAWLFAQCTGDWIMRVDGDEVPSQAFLRRLPGLLGERRIQQFWTANAWLFGEGPGVLRGLPWSSDFVVRLIRNDGAIRVPGVQHAHVDPRTPREYLAEPFYHLELLISPPDRRREKVVRYEVARPRLRAAGGGRLNEGFYLPELRSTLELASVPGEDRHVIERALRPSEPGPSRTAPAAEPPLVALHEMDRMWEGRSVPESAYRATIEPLEPHPSLAPAERTSLYFHVANEGSERWPARLEESPQIRLSYRWLNVDLSVHTPEGARSPFSRPLGPGETILTPLEVEAPAAPGEYVLEVDVVHENVRWFDRPCRVAARVREPDLPPVGARLREMGLPRMRALRRLRIPRTIHRVWLGTEQVPEEHEHFAATFAEQNPGWKMCLWRDEDLSSLEVGAAEKERARSHSELSNLVRYEVLRRHGGVYVDTDVECRRPLAPLLRGISAFAALEAPGRVGTAILGATPGHPLFERAARQSRETLGLGVNSPDANGPLMLSLMIEQDAGVTVFGAEIFYPRRWDQADRRDGEFHDAYAVHHWTLSWLKGAAR